MNHQNQRQSQDQENIRLLKELSGNLPYQPPTYTSVTEFTASFPALTSIRHNFYSEPAPLKPDWIAEPPYPQIIVEPVIRTLLSKVYKNV